MKCARVFYAIIQKIRFQTQKSTVQRCIVPQNVEAPRFETTQNGGLCVFYEIKPAQQI